MITLVGQYFCSSISKSINFYVLLSILFYSILPCILMFEKKRKKWNKTGLKDISHKYAWGKFQKKFKHLEEWKIAIGHIYPSQDLYVKFVLLTASALVFMSILYPILSWFILHFALLLIVFFLNHKRGEPKNIFLFLRQQSVTFGSPLNITQG